MGRLGSGQLPCLFQALVIQRFDLEDGTVLLGINKGIQQIVEGVPVCLRVEKVAHLVLVGTAHPVGFLNVVHSGLGDGLAVKEAAVVLAGLHHHGEIGKLRRTLVDVQTKEVVFQNGAHGLPLGVAVVQIDLHQHIKQVAQDMAAAHAGVDDLELFRLHFGVLGADILQLLLHLRLLRGLVQIILPVGLVEVRVTLDPQTAKAVFHHVAHDPVRGKQLGRRRDVLLADLDVLFQVGKHLVLGFGVVILVHPAHDLHLTQRLAVLIGGVNVKPALVHLVDQTVDHAVGVVETERNQQLGKAVAAVQILKQPGQDAAQVVALLEEQKTEQVIFLVGILQVEDALFFVLGKLQIAGERCLDQIGQLLPGDLAGKHPHREIAVDLHKADGDQTVEPCIGDLLDELFQLLFWLIGGIEAAHMGSKVLVLVHGPHAPDGLDVAIAKVKHQLLVRAGLRLHDAFFGDAVPLQLERHICDQLAACFHRKLLDGCLFHSVPLFVYQISTFRVSPLSSFCFRAWRSFSI